MDGSRQFREELRPSFFEMYAQERLTTALRPAFRYVLEVLSVRRPHLLRFAEKSDEILTLIATFVELSQLSKKSSTLSESFYGLRRSRHFDSPSAEKLSPHQIFMSVLFSVFFPYIHLKLDQMYINNRPPNNEVQQSDRVASGGELRLSLRHPVPTSIFEMVPTWRGRLQKIVGLLKDRGFRNRCMALFQRWYPAANTFSEILVFIFNVLYLFGHTRYFNPLLAVQQLIVRRVRGSELNASAALGNTLESQPGVLSFLTTVADNAVTGVKCGFIGGVFLIRFLEFYYAAESRLPKRKMYVPPPPVPMLPADDFDAKLVKSTTSCPLCRRPRTNPAACAASGYVFCYRCIFTYVQEHGNCPVTKMSASIEDVIRVYEDQSL